ncbi:putative disease resistance protein [Cardamine amara subsp. amara]|uniref:Disease resistance protein n=1 Tax=Cardamine amara subsp. amara TaxID=228776 RepID=A0ABD1APZ2_CARAN
MGNTISISFAADEIFLSVWDSLTARADFILKFEDNLIYLKKVLEDLRARRDDVLYRIDAEELKGGKRLASVARWLLSVQTIETESNLLVNEASEVQQRLSAYGFCSNNIISTYGCGKKISKMLKEVQFLFFRGDFEMVAETALPPVVISRDHWPVFGLDTTLEKTWKSLMDDENRVLGIYGMGGVGKTTLLTLINNKFVYEMKDIVDVVIWVTVSKDVYVEKIQDDVGKRLGLYDENWRTKPQLEKAGKINMVLNYLKPRFVLLLDDLWEKVNLTAIGIPLYRRKHKIVFTTRFRDVCRSMCVDDDIKVEFLSKEDAFNFFNAIVRGPHMLNGETLFLAKEIVESCHGLPLVLLVVGKSLSSRMTVHELRHARDILQYSPDINKKLFGVVKLSYDYLREEQVKLCFRYCALFPDEYAIRIDELVEYWIGEGIIDDQDGRRTAIHRGYYIIGTLVGAGLLLKDGESGQTVHMHDIIREMALKINDGKRFVVETDAGLRKLPVVRDWTTVTKMSLMNNEIESILDDPEFLGQAPLVTLFLQNNKLVEIVGNFFVVMSSLVVLDLSRNLGLTELPEEISMLVALRYLSLLGTRIKVLPEGFRKLGNLIHFDLEFTSSLQSLNQISSLLKLQVLRFYGSAAALDSVTLNHLEGLNDLIFLTITINEDSVLTEFLGCERLKHCTQGLYLEGLQVSVPSFAATFGALGCLRNLEMINCDIIDSKTEWQVVTRHQSPTPTHPNQITPSHTWFKSLLAVVINSCEQLRDLTWLIYAANLESLSITFSPKMEELIYQKIATGFEVEPFQKLQYLRLYYLDELRSIHSHPLSFPRLQKVDIKYCPKLLKLPLIFPGRID